MEFMKFEYFGCMCIERLETEWLRIEFLDTKFLKKKLHLKNCSQVNFRIDYNFV